MRGWGKKRAVSGENNEGSDEAVASRYCTLGREESDGTWDRQCHQGMCSVKHHGMSSWLLPALEP